jgi:hypothetical protein
MSSEQPTAGGTRSFRSIPRIRRFHGENGHWRSPLITGAILIVVLTIVVAAVYYFVFSGRVRVHAEVVDFSKSVEQIRELSTLRSHYRFGVVVREESGNVIVRRLADQGELIGMEGIGGALFQDPTMFVELHGVASYGARLDDLASRMRQDDSTVTIALPPVQVLDAHLITADTRVVARMKGLFRSSNNELLLEADRHGEGFVREYAEQDSAMQAFAADRLKDVLALLVERAGKRAVFN